MTLSLPTLLPTALDYHSDLADLLQTHEKGLWQWFASDTFSESMLDAQRLAILKSTYRLSRETHAELYRRADDVAKKIGLLAPVTLYQSVNDASRNASLIYIPNQVHIILMGNILSELDVSEVDFILAHEMAHYLHNCAGGEKYLIVDRLLDWICAEQGRSDSHLESFRLSRLYQEIFADRVGLFVCGDLDASIRALLKVTTGTDQVSAVDYLQQVGEVLTAVPEKGSEEYSHPEIYIRVQALADWNANSAAPSASLVDLVEGPKRLEKLDLVGQKIVVELTESFLADFILQSGVESELVDLHLRNFFEEFDRSEFVAQRKTSLTPTTIDKESISELSDSMREYLCYLLLDFSRVDEDLGDEPLEKALTFTESLGLADQFEKLVKEELKISVKKLASLKQEAAKHE